MANNETLLNSLREMLRELLHILRTYGLECRFILKIENFYFYYILTFSFYSWVFIQLYMCI